jgi:hypothetical protein
LENKLSGIKFTLVLSLPIFSLPVYPFSCRVVRLRRMMSLEFRGWLADKFNVPEKTLSLHSSWEVSVAPLSDDGST